jgi:hypothetical protein
MLAGDGSMRMECRSYIVWPSCSEDYLCEGPGLRYPDMLKGCVTVVSCRGKSRG